MTGPDPATAAVRLAVRRALADLPGDAPVAAAVSGGGDSLALAAGLAFVRPGSVALVVDHGLQPGSAEVAGRAAEQCRSLGLLAEVLVAPPRLDTGSPGSPQDHSPVDSPLSGTRAGGGPEAEARTRRYAALDAAADRRGLVAVLLGHTRDDQAETVLLGLARGAGSRSLAGMAAVRGRYRRPLLGLPRATVRQACAAAGLQPWEDPHNADPRHARVRARSTVLPVLERELGPGVASALARTAAQLREDADALDALAAAEPLAPELDCARLAALPAALRARVLKRWAQARCDGAITAAHVDALRVLVDAWAGQGAVALPGGVRVQRRDGRLASSP